jgi:hypothetical protein
MCGCRTWRGNERTAAAPHVGAWKRRGTSEPFTRLDITSATHVVKRKEARGRKAARVRSDDTAALETSRLRTDSPLNRVLKQHTFSSADTQVIADERAMITRSMVAAMLVVAREADKDDSDAARAFSPTFFCIFSSNTLPTVHPCIHTHISFSLLS